MRETKGPWNFLRWLHCRRAQAVKAEWHQAQRELLELQTQRDAATERVQAMQNHRLDVGRKMEEEKAAEQVNIPHLLAVQRYLEDVQHQLDALSKEEVRCQNAVDNQEKKGKELWQQFQLHEQKSAIYQQRNERLLRYEANCQEELNDEEANEGLMARALMNRQAQRLSQRQ